MTELVSIIKKMLRDITLFAEHGSGLKLRSYQTEVARVIADSVINRRGLSIVVMFPRQSGKNELQAQIETYLLVIFSTLNAEIVKVSPTWKPQTLNAMRRLERVLCRNLITAGNWTKETGYIFRYNTARIFFFSGSPTANIVGATASTLLEVDEAQDVQIAKYDKDIAPMAASTNATRVFWGTAWTRRTLLARELRAAHAAQVKDGIRRVFVLTADDVADVVPDYGKFVQAQVERMGRNHPTIMTQYFSEEIDSTGGMFPPERVALMTGDHSRRLEPGESKRYAHYAVLIDVAGEDESAAAAGSDGDIATSDLHNPGRDSTTATVVWVDQSTISDPLLKAPLYRVIFRKSWTGAKQSTLYTQIRALVDLWRARHIVIDSTGVGAGLASFLGKAYPNKVLPYAFNSSTKSKLGYDFLTVVETGRFKDYREYDADRAAFLQQLASCQMTAIEGPAHLIKWGVPDGTRAPETGELLHDDWILSAALCAVLDQAVIWTTGDAPLLVQAADPLAELDKGF